MTSDDVHAYWIGEPPATAEELAVKNKLWFGGGPAVDDEIRARFGGLVEQARAGKLDDWHATARGSLAWLLLIDQFSRNLYRDSAQAFALDGVAQRWARDSWESGRFDALTTIEGVFAILPFEHAEDLELQRYGCAHLTRIALAAPPHLKDYALFTMTWARKHLDVVARFGRFPHRNEVLGRAPTPEETEYLAFCKLAGSWL